MVYTFLHFVPAYKNKFVLLKDIMYYQCFDFKYVRNKCLKITKSTDYTELRE